MATPFPKLTFGISDQERQLYGEYAELAKQMHATRSLGDAVLQGLRAQYDIIRADLAPAVANVKDRIDATAGSLEALSRWDLPRAKAWFEDQLQRLPATPQRDAVRGAWAQVDTTIQRIEEDVTTLRALAAIRDQLATGGIDQAMGALLGVLRGFDLRRSGIPAIRSLRAAVWQTRLASIQQLAAALAALSPDARRRLQASDGPVGAVLAVTTSLEGIVEALTTLKAETLAWLAQAGVLSAPAKAVGDLPEPRGQQRLDLAQDLSTSFDLLTVPGPREENDQVMVTYTFYRQDPGAAGGWTEVPGGWSDRFRLRVFGFRSRVLASLAFVQRHGEATWSPTASFSWVLRRRQWPSGGNSGLHGGSLLDGVGVGLSTMTLDFDGSQSVEIGIGAGLSLLGDRIIGGYGVNLQSAHDRGYWYFSIRLFSASGGLGGRQ